MDKPVPPENTVFMDGSLDNYYKCCTYPKLRKKYFFFGKIVCRNCGSTPVFAYTSSLWFLES